MDIIVSEVSDDVVDDINYVDEIDEHGPMRKSKTGYHHYYSVNAVSIKSFLFH